MLITHEREKLLQAISFFLSNTKKCGKTKLFKLLYFLDFEHFKMTGRSVTGLTYYAWKLGPVPTALYDEFDAPDGDFQESFDRAEIQTAKGVMQALSPKQAFSADHFTARELKIMQKLAAEYRDLDAEQMVEETHLENLPWDKVYNQAGKKQAEIPYDLALPAEDADLVLSLALERRELLEKLK